MGSIIHYKMLYIYIYISRNPDPQLIPITHIRCHSSLVCGSGTCHGSGAFMLGARGASVWKSSFEGPRGKKPWDPLGCIPLAHPVIPPEAWPFGVILYFWSKNICSTGGWLDVGRYFENFRSLAHVFFGLSLQKLLRMDDEPRRFWYVVS